ncbi:hypothetical protein AAFF_G00417010 [Aldrovandia affinis]|uniref:Coiled-coil domain-containing protein 83 n=1 Tax=Aldrovandia affinis TaxID=143900 RepID=A0AAD7SAK1_9TELE|nr:hypothetical protein AAFF_G00417010 [Aldrovandia affinis]
MRKEVAEFQDEVSFLEYKKQIYNNQRQQLKEEQTGHIRTLHKQLKEKEGKLAQKEVECREQVEEALQDNSELTKTHEQQLEELQTVLGSLEQEVKTLQAEKQIWLDDKVVTSQENQQQVQQLEDKLAQMHKTFQEMSDSIEWTMKEDMKKTDKKTEKKMEKEKHLASERAIEHLDKHSLLAIKENKCLKKALSFYKSEVARLEVAVQKLEEKNLSVLSELFDLQFADAGIFSDVFSTQEASLGVSGSGTPGDTIEGQDIIDKPAEADRALGWPTALERAGPSSSCSQPADQPTGSPTQGITDLLYGRQSNIQDCPHLGALKLLNVEGKTTPLHQAVVSCDTLPPELQQTTAHWPVTTHMILTRFN